MPEGRTAVVTGAGSGIGRAVARALLERGWQVALAGRRPEALAQTAEGYAARSLILPTDVSQEAEVDALFGAVAARWSCLGLLFNNAGVFPPASLIDEMPVARWREAVDINLTGAFLCARAAFGLMRRQQPQGGRIINNGSISAHAPRPQSVGYTATKHAITGLTRQLSLDGRPYSIACGQIDIGNATTELAAGFGQSALQADGSRRAEPMMEMRQVADAVCLMAELPLSANVQFMTILATNMPFVGRG